MFGLSFILCLCLLCFVLFCAYFLRSFKLQSSMLRKKPFTFLNGSWVNFSWFPLVIVFPNLCHSLLLVFFLILNLTFIYLFMLFYLVMMDGGGEHASWWSSFIVSFVPSSTKFFLAFIALLYWCFSWPSLPSFVGVLLSLHNELQGEVIFPIEGPLESDSCEYVFDAKTPTSTTPKTQTCTIKNLID